MNWIQTFSGRRFDLRAPRPEDVNIIDIAYSLSMICRFGGHCRFHYSVAQHSVLVSRQVAREDAFAALLHDAAEAYVGDMVSPLKRLIDGFETIEKAVREVIALRFSIPSEMSSTVKRADLALLAAEREQVMGPCKADWTLTVPAAKVRIEPMTSNEAREAFCREFYALEGRQLAGERS